MARHQPPSQLPERPLTRSGAVFISHASRDQREALALAQTIEASGRSCWLACRDVAPGENYQEAIVRAIRSTRAVVLVFSRRANSSEEIKKELSLASRHHVPVIALRIENVKPSDAFAYELSTRQWIDLFANRPAGIAALLGQLDALPGGAPPPRVAPSPAKRRLPAAPALALALVLALTLVGLAAWLGLRHRATPPDEPRTAVFDFDAPTGDAALVRLAGGISDTIVSTMAAMHLPLVSRAETQPLAAAARLSRARALGAHFVIQGNIRQSGDTLAVAARIEDLSSGTTAWSASFEGPSAAAAALEAQVAARATDTLRCATRERDSLDADSFALLLATCDRKGARSGDPDALRELIARLPGSATPRAWLAISLIERAGYAPPIAKAQMLREAGAAARRAIALDPHLGDAHYAIGQLAEARHDGFATREAIVLRGLAADPNHPSINRQYGSLLQEVGRVRESLPYLELAVRGDPLSPFKPLVLATTLNALGRDSDADQVLADVITRWPLPTLWRARVEYAALAGNVPLTQGLLAKAPGDAERPEDDDCLQKLARSVAAAKSRHAASDGAALVRHCTDSGSIASPVKAFAAIGALDDAYAAFRGMMNDGSHQSLLLFGPSTRTMRRDPRFLPLLRDLGLVDYWRLSGKRPDICGEPGLSFDCTRALGGPN